MREATDWEPSDDEIAWTKTNLEPLQIGGTWAPQGLEYERTGEAALRLVSIVNHDGTREAHTRVCKVLEMMDWTVDDDDVERVVNQPTPDEVAANQQSELERIQSIVSSWVCPDDECEEPLVNAQLDRCEWVNYGQHTFHNPETGEDGEADRWLAHITCEGCGTIIPMQPLDYGYIAGEDLFYTWVTNNYRYRVLTREDTVALIDAGGQGIPLGSIIDGVEVPPHMQGTYCLRAPILDEEE